MSRTPVRAAFVQLEAEGFVRLYPKRGAIVVPVTAQEAESVIETRWVIERYAIERADAALGRVLTGLAEGADVDEADRAFHRALVAGTGNEILLSLYDSLRDRQRRMGRASARPRAQGADHRRAPRARQRDRGRRDRAGAADPAPPPRRRAERAARPLRRDGATRYAGASLRWSQEATEAVTNCSATRLLACSGVTCAPSPPP